MTVEIETPRFVLRQLREADVTERYLGWFCDPEASDNISAAATTHTLDDLRRYVIERMDREDVLFLGIFDRHTDVHVGNVKYEPVDRARGYAVMGILIGEISYRNKGVAQEVLAVSGAWLREHCSVREILLGVHRDNRAALRAYEKVGYRVSASRHLAVTEPGVLIMMWNP